MLSPSPYKSRKISEVQVEGNTVLCRSEAGTHRLIVVTENIIRVTYTEKDSFSDVVKPGVILPQAAPGPEVTKFSCKENDSEIALCTAKITLKINRETASYSYFDCNGKLLLSERERDSKILDEFQSYILSENDEIETERIQTADGIKEFVREAVRVPGEKLYHTFLHLNFTEGEALYGLGQNDDGILNLRGQKLYLHQANMKIAVPVLVSTKGYGLLYDSYSTMIFSDNGSGSYLYSEADKEMDFYFMAGKPDEIVSSYRVLTGKATMLPKWAYGFVQSQERYETADEIIGLAKEYRRRGIGLDCLVLDWMSWPDGMWGQKSFDEKRFPDPQKMTDDLHNLNVHFMLSIWPNMCKECDNNAEMKKENCLLPASDLYNPLKEKARKTYWNQVKRGLFSKGVDAFWCDSSEPITVEWVHRNKPEESATYYEYVKALSDVLPADYTNSYPLFHARSIYEGQRGETSSKRVCNLTRSAYTGQQRYGTIMWSGDIAASWNTFKKQIPGALNFSASGIPYWTVDAGAFFVKKGDFWYWNGDFKNPAEDKGYAELYVRMYQWAAFLPMMRSHGTDVRRELWAFEGEDNRFYEALVKANELRYKLMPYIYSTASKVWKDDASFIKMLSFQYPDDTKVHSIADQYFFGDSLMVCPVTEPLYYGPGNAEVHTSSLTRKVYLPEGDDWYDFYSGTFYKGGQWILADAPIDRIPVFVRDGSLIPVNKEKTDHANAQSAIEFIKFSSGKPAEFQLYEDSGDGYDYESGSYTISLHTSL